MIRKNTSIDQRKTRTIIITPTKIIGFLDRFFASAFCRKLPFWLGGATLLLLALAFLAYRADLRPLRDIALLGLAAGFCFCAMCVLLDSDASSRARLTGLAQLILLVGVIAVGVLAFLPGPKTTKTNWDELVRSTAPKLKNTEPSARLSEYVQNANKGVINYTGGPSERKVSNSLRQAVLKRDSHRCIICSATNRELQIDHSRAIMNGGSNDPKNLAALCTECHPEKTKMDNSLRRNREKAQKRKNK